MGRDDWYRGPDWDEKTRQEFELRLGRARSQRSQYLRIKGMGLTHAYDPRVWPAGRELLSRVLEEHVDDAVQVLSAHADLAASFAREARYEEAADHYRTALRLQDGGINVDTRADLALAELIVAADWEEQFDEALYWLDHYFETNDPFPSTRFRALLAEAQIADRTGRADDARQFASAALGLLSDNRAPFPRHPDVGLIETDEATFRELERLIN